MTLVWKRMYLGSYHGYTEDGRQVAQVGHVIGPNGTSEGWLVHLLHEPEELGRYPDEHAAKAAAEAALGFA
ncbi:MAG TPA: hypothetical protein VIL36_13105 [Acidimicrobiales bacterium]